MSKPGKMDTAQSPNALSYGRARWGLGPTVLFAVGALVILVAIVAAGFVFIGHLGSPPGGPLAPTDDSITRVSYGVKPGVPFSYGLLFLDNRGTLPATVDAVHLIDPTGSITLVQAAVVPGSHHGSIGFIREFPPPRLTLLPAAGFEVAPTSSTSLPTEVILGLEEQARDRGSFAGIAVDYHIGTDRFQAQFLGNRLAVCAGPGATASPCPPPA